MFYEQSTLSNGVRVVTESIDSVRSVAVGVWFAVGARDETPAEAGMSHFLEHMLFKGTSSRSAADISEEFDSIGGYTNAFTSKEYTCFYTRVIDQHVPKAVEVLADMACNATLTDEACANEREVVIEEIARMEDTPEDQIHELFERALWPSHPIGLPILGSKESVSTFDHEMATDFRGRHYTTGTCVVAAAGNISHEAMVSHANLHLGALPIGERRSRTSVTLSRSQHLATLEKDSEQAHICYGVTGVHAHHPDRFALGVINQVLGGSMSSRLFQEIREKSGLAYAVHSVSSHYHDTGELTVYAGTRPANLHRVVALIREQFERVSSEGLRVSEICRARESLKGRLVLSLENTHSRMIRLGKGVTIDSEVLSVDEIMSRIDAVDSAGVSRVAAEYLAARPVIAIIGPNPPHAVEELFA